MRESTLKTIMECAVITGDTVIVVEGERALAIMDFDRYRNSVLAHHEVIGLSEQELLDKINRTIAIWKQEHADIDTMPEYDTLRKPDYSDLYRPRDGTEISE